MKKFIIAMAALLLLCGCEKGAEASAEISETSQTVTTAAAAEDVTETTSETAVTTVAKTTVAGHDSEKHEYYDVTTEEFAAAVKKLYNINMTAWQAQSMTDETGFMRRNCGHGGLWFYNELTGYEETDSEVRVTVDYYGDSLYFYPTLQSEYTFSKNEDGTITLQKVEKLFDKGYEIASFST